MKSSQMLKTDKPNDFNFVRQIPRNDDALKTIKKEKEGPSFPKDIDLRVFNLDLENDREEATKNQTDKKENITFKSIDELLREKCLEIKQNCGYCYSKVSRHRPPFLPTNFHHSNWFPHSFCRFPTTESF